MLKIRLARIGKKKSPTYRFVVSESARDLYGRQLEILGHYNPFSKVCEVKKERILYWISKGAQVSPTAHNLLVDQNVISAEKVKASKAGKKKTKKEEAPAEGATDGAADEKPEEKEKPAEAELKPEEKRELRLTNPGAEEKPVEEKKEEKAPVEPKAEKKSAEDKSKEEKPVEEKPKSAN